MDVKAKDVKRSGLKPIEEAIRKYGIAVLSSRGVRKYVVLPIEEYERIRESELEKAIKEAEEDLKKGRYVVETAEEHFRRLGI